MAVRALAAALPVALALVLAASGTARADGPAAVTLTLKNHRFTPAAFTVPPGRKVRVTLINQDPATEEFDSRDLRREALVTPMGRTTFDIGPLQAGQYSFMGELHARTAHGEITAVTAGR